MTFGSYGKSMCTFVRNCQFSSKVALLFAFSPAFDVVLRILAILIGLQSESHCCFMLQSLMTYDVECHMLFSICISSLVGCSDLLVIFIFGYLFSYYLVLINLVFCIPVLYHTYVLQILSPVCSYLFIPCNSETVLHITN